MDLNLNGKRVLITGGSKGIGLAAALGFAAEGAEVIIAARTAETLAAAREAIRARHNVPVSIEAIDLAARGNAEALHQRHPDVDILVNNAGAIPGGDIAAIDETKWREAWELKVFAYVNLTRAYFAKMRERRRGVIVNVLGMAGVRPTFDYVAGSTANAGLMAFTRAMGSRSVDHNVRVVALNPPATATDRLVTLARRRAESAFGDPERWQETLKNLPFGRPATPEEITNMVVFLAAERASYMNGGVVDVHGGGAYR
jgi:NAD(P)-dependent dehydrogenase (short-subunit alcohol dehydrogenase family)